jgi:serine/threonine protein kinase
VVTVRESKAHVPRRDEHRAVAPVDNIGRYIVRELIGHGGMGVLYLALDPKIDRLVALKVLRIDNDELRLRFEREARVVGRFQHPNIVTIFDSGEHKGEPFIAMEYISGETLAERLSRSDPLSVEERLRLAEDLCDGLAYAHARQVFHRDIKPANLMIESETRRLKILDFGIAKAPARDTGITVAGERIGSPNYMAPEQHEGKLVDHRCDVFAVGLVLYEMLSYRQAFPGETGHLVAYRILHESPQPLQEIDPDIDPDLVSVVNRAIEKSPSRRYQDLATMRADLQRIRGRLSPERLSATVVGRRAIADTLAMPPRRETDRLSALRRRRESTIASHLDAARSALTAGDVAAALSAAEQAAVLSPEDPKVLSLLEEVHRADEDQQINGLLITARQRLTSQALTGVSELVDQALLLRPDHPEALALRREVRELISARERDRQRSAQVQQSLDRGRRSLQAGAFETAARSALEALAMEPGHGDARALREEALEAIRLRDERAAQDRHARQVVESAREDFAAGHVEQALQRLATFKPEHAAVTEALAALRAEHARRLPIEPTAIAPPVAERRPEPPPSALENAPLRREFERVPPPADLRAKPAASSAGRHMVPALMTASIAAVAVLVGLWLIASRPSEPTEAPPAQPVQTKKTEEQLKLEAEKERLATLEAEKERLAKLNAEKQRETNKREAEKQREEAQARDRERTRLETLKRDIARLLADGRTALGQARYAEASQAFDALLKLDPDNADAQEGNRAVVAARRLQDLNASATRALENGDFTQALRLFEQVLAISPQNATAIDGRERARKAQSLLGGRPK